MTDPNQIPYLVKLLDDESTHIQKTVYEELDAFGPLLKDEIRKIAFPLSSRQQRNLELIFERHQRLRLIQFWPTWFKEKGTYARLEAALSIIAEYLTCYQFDIKLKKVLDDLAGKFQVKYHSKDPRILAEFLFNDIGLKGNDEDYYNPLNSNLIYVIQEKKGIPISLVCVYMLVGYRLGILVEGCPFPGHFLARINLFGEQAFVDCYSAGQLIMEEDFFKVKEEMNENIMDALSERVDSEAIIRRYLANLIRAYQVDGDQASIDLMVQLFSDLDVRQSNKALANITPDEIIEEWEPRYKPGEVVIHTRYKYRGIIVDVDEQCNATDEWYYSNQTQPRRDQPWFHVLVNDSEQVTYVAENNLRADKSRNEINHPLVTYFFVRSKDGLYVRNENAWPETDF